MTKISVIIPTRNRAEMLQRAIESAENAGKDIEIIVVDDASTDETESSCRNSAGIVYLRMGSNVGLARARNAGISKSTGEFIAFLDDDDLRLPGSLDVQAKMLERNETLGFVYGQVQIGDPKTCLPTGEVRPGRCPTGDIFWQLLRGNFIYVPSVLVRKQRLEAIGLFAQDVPGTEDWDAWLKLAATFTVDAVQEPVGVYRDFTRGSGQMSSNLPRMCKSGVRTHDRALRSSRALAASQEMRREQRCEFMNAVWDALVMEGYNSLSERKLRYAAKNYITAMQLHPKRAARFGAVSNFVRSIVSHGR